MSMPTSYKAPDPKPNEKKPPQSKTEAQSQQKPKVAAAPKKEAPLDTSKMSFEDVMQRMQADGQKKLEEEHKKKAKVAAPFAPSQD